MLVRLLEYSIAIKPHCCIDEGVTVRPDGHDWMTVLRVHQQPVTILNITWMATSVVSHSDIHSFMNNKYTPPFSREFAMTSRGFHSKPKPCFISIIHH